jgi:lipid A 4'-phosphatase
MTLKWIDPGERIRNFPFWMIFGATCLAAGAWLTLDPRPDLAVSGWFYTSGQGFSARLAEPFTGFSILIQWTSRCLGVLMMTATVASWRRRRPVLSITTRAWLFLLLGLILLPGILANVVFKNHWGRARPFQTAPLGGEARFTPALVVSDQCNVNCSFVSGDAAFGFYLHAFGYVAVTRRKRRQCFWAGLGFGSLAGLNRIIMGAHFLSDVFFAGVFMLLGSSVLHMAFFGRKQTAACWRDFMFRPPAELA